MESLSLSASEAIRLFKKRGVTNKGEIKKGEVEELAEFIQENVLVDKEMLEYLVLPKGLQRGSPVQLILSFIAWLLRRIK